MPRGYHWRRTVIASSYFVIFVLFGLLAVALPGMIAEAAATGTVFYVAPSGADSNPETPQQPWHTIQHAADVMGPGDAVVCASFPPYECERFSDADINRQTLHPWIEAHSRYADSRFGDPSDADFWLLAGSPAIGDGTPDGAPATGLAGRPRPQSAGFDIGAYKHSVSRSPMPTRIATPTVTRLPSSTPTRTATRTATRTPTLTARPSVTRTPTWTRRPSFTPTRTPTRTLTRTMPRTATPTCTPTITVTSTWTRPPSATSSSTATRTTSRSPTPRSAATRTWTPTGVGTSTRTPTNVTASVTPTPASGSTPQVVPVIDAAMKARLRAVFLRGQTAGNRPGVFVKIGDSISESASFLQDVGCGLENVGAHSELNAVIAFFRAATFPSSYTSAWCEIANSFTRDSVSAVAGWAAEDALQLVSVNGCSAPYDTALGCELHLLRPSMALIMYGTNDLERFNDLDAYGDSLTAIVTETLDAAVIPILSTIPPRLDDPTLGARVTGYNQVVMEVAQTQQVPVLNYWLAMEGPQMVNQGIGADGVHPNLLGGCAPDCLSADFSEAGLRFGYNQRNFTAIQTFARIKAVVIDDGAADPDAGRAFTPTPTVLGTPTATAAGNGPSLAGCPVFPADNEWNRDISGDPVDENSANYIASISLGADTDIIGEAHLHADFGSPSEYGMPYVVVPATQPKVPITFTEYGDESDPGPYPVPADAPVEAGTDHHVLVLDAGACVVYELYHAEKDPVGPGWFAGSGAVFDLNSNALRPEGWTSCDQAGLPILPGLVRYDEVAAGEIRHALRFTVWRPQAAWVHPATHYGTSSNRNDPPMGMRVRLKASYDISSYSGQARVVLQALKRHGLLVADTGTSWYITGARDPRWNDADLDQLKHVPGRAFEVVQLGTIMRP